MAKLTTVVPPAPPPPARYVLELNAEEAKHLRALFALYRPGNSVFDSIHSALSAGLGSHDSDLARTVTFQCASYASNWGVSADARR